MDMATIKEEILLQLTGYVVSMELSDESLTRIVNSALREIQRYIDVYKMITIPFSKCIDMSPYKVSSVIGVRRSEGYMVSASESNEAMMDPMYATQWQLLSTTGNIANVNDYAYNFAAWNTLLQMRNTTSTDLAFLYDKMSNNLYVNISSSVPKSITVLYIPRFDSVDDITSDFWIDNLVKLSVALAKVTVGRVRTKFKQTNALWTLDGDTLLEEGKTELAALREELKASTQLVYGID